MNRNLLLLVYALLTAAYAQKSCNTLSVCFAIDESGSVSSSEFKTLTNAVIQMATTLKKLSPSSLFSAVAFDSTAVKVQAPTSVLKTFTNSVTQHKQREGDTSLAKGMQLCQSIMGSSSSLKKVIVLLTDGEDNRSPSGKSVAPEIKNSGITIATVGIGSGTNSADLKSIASTNLFRAVGAFSALPALLNKLADTVCQETSCPPVNICLAVDESGSISSTEWQSMVATVTNLITQFKARSSQARFAIASFNSNANTVSSLTNNAESAKNAMKNYKQRRGSTSTGSGLNLCATLLKNAKIPKVILLITDGADNSIPFGKTVAPGIKKGGITIATVGIGNGVVDSVLKEIATNDDLYKPVKDFSDLVAQVDSITTKVCKAPQQQCADVHCTRCNTVLECRVSTAGTFGQRVCDQVTKRTTLCQGLNGAGLTKCSQSCDRLIQGVKCFKGESWPQSQVTIGVSKCKAGGFRVLGNGCAFAPAIASSFASYKVCFNGNQVSVSCKKTKCSTGVCKYA